MAHPPDNVDWAILSVLGGEGPRTLQQLAWHLNLLDKIDLLFGLRRLLNDGKIVRDGNMYAIPARNVVRNPASKAPPVDPLVHINALIRNQTSYGFKTWPAKGTLLRWSNSQAAWSIWGGSMRLAKTRFPMPDEHSLSLDADMIVVPYPRTVVEPLLKKLLSLPLYSMSTEQRRRSWQ